MNNMGLRTLYFCLLILLTACGGGGSGGGIPTPTTLASLQPYGLSAIAINAGVTLNWPRISGAVSYNLYWSTSAGGSKTKISGVTPPYSHGPATGVNLSNGYNYYYYTYTVVRAEGESAYSAELPIIPNPPGINAPADLEAYAGDGQVQLYWTGVANATLYNVYWKTAPGVSTTDTKVSDITSPFVLTGLTNDAPYYFVVTAVIGGTERDVSREVATIPYTPEPLTPLNVIATPSSGQVSLTWDDVPDATSYVLLWSTSAGVNTSASRVDNVTSPYVHTGLTNGQHYYYALVAVNSRGPSPLSAEADVQPTAGGAAVPAVPTGSAPDTPSHVKVFAGHLQNTINADDDSNTVRYTIYWNTTGGVSTSNASITNVTLPYTHSGLTDGTRVYYRIVAMNRYGASGVSAEASAVPQNELLGDTVVTQIADPELQSCVNTNAAENGWFYVRQVDYLHCDQTGAPTDITAMTGIDVLPNLIWMHIINDDTAADVSAVAQLSNLSALTLRGMQLSTASINAVIGSLSHLTFLDLYNNAISTVPMLPVGVIWLQLERNQISDVSPLAGLTALQELYLSNNAIAGSGLGNVNTLTTLTNAYWITLGENSGMSCTEMMALRTALGSTVVIRNLDYTKTPWEPLPFPDVPDVGDCS